MSLRFFTSVQMQILFQMTFKVGYNYDAPEFEDIHYPNYEKFPLCVSLQDFNSGDENKPCITTCNEANNVQNSKLYNSPVSNTPETYSQYQTDTSVTKSSATHMPGPDKTINQQRLLHKADPIKHLNSSHLKRDSNISQVQTHADATLITSINSFTEIPPHPSPCYASACDNISQVHTHNDARMITSINKLTQIPPKPSICDASKCDKTDHIMIVKPPKLQANANQTINDEMMSTSFNQLNKLPNTIIPNEPTSQLANAHNTLINLTKVSGGPNQQTVNAVTLSMAKTFKAEIASDYENTTHTMHTPVKQSSIKPAKVLTDFDKPNSGTSDKDTFMPTSNKDPKTNQIHKTRVTLSQLIYPKLHANNIKLQNNNKMETSKEPISNTMDM